MDQVGTIYRMFGIIDENARFGERQAFKRALTAADFRWSESSADSRITIHDGGDSLDNNRYRVGFLEGDHVFVFRSERLESFLSSYDM